MNKNNVAIDYLRAFVVVLVLAHHSALAYVSFAPHAVKAFASEPHLWAAFPVVDSQHWRGLDLLVVFNDTYFMALMFLLSGLFVWHSLMRKGSAQYLADRSLRLGVPFVVAVALLNPLAYYPAYVLSGADPALGAYARECLTLGYWSHGPSWFIAVLLALDILIALLHKIYPRWFDTLGKLSAHTDLRPARYIFGLIGISIVTYAIGYFTFGPNPNRWLSFGPFTIQASRILLYPTYFLAGVGLGIGGVDRGLLARDGKLSRRWPMWLAAAILSFVAFLIFSLKLMSAGAAGSLALRGMYDAAFALCCGASCFFMLAIFVRFVNRRLRLADSVSANAYGMYLLHYIFVIWTQYALLGTNLPALVKFLIVLMTTLVLSWGTTAAFRRGVTWPRSGQLTSKT